MKVKKGKRFSQMFGSVKKSNIEEYEELIEG